MRGFFLFYFCFCIFCLLCNLSKIPARHFISLLAAHPLHGKVSKCSEQNYLMNSKFGNCITKILHVILSNLSFYFNLAGDTVMFPVVRKKFLFYFNAFQFFWQINSILYVWETKNSSSRVPHGSGLG